TAEDGRGWQQHEVPMPDGSGTGKGVAVFDVDGNGRMDIVFTCENASDKHGVGWLSADRRATDPEWTFHPISGDGPGTGVKFDLIQVLDVDGDGDLDIITCEERDQLGLIWYENPARSSADQ